MKKIAKKITAIMLSLVMVFGCIPSLTNEASAAEPTMTLASIIATYDGDFPTTKEDAWTNENGCIVYWTTDDQYGHIIYFYKGESLKEMHTENEELTLKGSDYARDNLTCIMTDDNLTSIIISGNSTAEINGTYKPADKPKTLVDFLPNNFPIDVQSAWRTIDGHRVYHSGNALNFYYGGGVKAAISDSEIFEFDGEKYVRKSGGNLYLYMDQDDLIKIVSTGGPTWGGTYLESIPIGSVAISATGELSNKEDSLTYFVEENDKYILSEQSGWLQEDLTAPASYDILAVGDEVYKVLTFESKFGYDFRSNPGVNIYSTIYGVEVLSKHTLDDGKAKIVVKKVVDIHKDLEVTIPVEVGKSCLDIKNDISITGDFDTITTQNIYLYNVTGKEILLTDDDTIEYNQDYIVLIILKDTQEQCSYSIKANDVLLDFISNASHQNHYSKPSTSKISAYYVFNFKQASSGSRKYKANDNDTAEKVSGSGKKGSTRTIVPEEGRKVSNVTVTDKKGNPIEVVMNEDGTYSFTQPASDVIIDVDYASREIKMEVGTIGAYVDGVGVNEYVTPKVRNNETMLPVRFIAENLGAKVDWNEKEPNMIYITRGDKRIEIKLGSNIIKVNGEEITLDSASFAEGNRTYVPFKLIENALDATVKLEDNNSNGIVITEK